MQHTNGNTTHYVPFVAPALIQHPTLSDSAKLTALTLLMHRNRESQLCYPTQEIIALERRVSDRTVRNDLTELRSHGLVEWQPRKAPRGKAKDRANAYDLTGLIALCDLPILKAEQLLDRKPRSGRDRKPRSAHSSDFRAIAEQQMTTYIDTAASGTHATGPEEYEKMAVPVPVGGNGKSTATLEDGDRNGASAHSARTAKVGPLKGLSSRQIHEQRIAPNGTSAYSDDVCLETDAWNEANRVVHLAGGEDFNPGDLSKLCDECGEDHVWWHARWFLSRLGSLDSKPAKPTAYFVACVREDYPVKPTWQIVTEYHAELAQVESRLAAGPDTYAEYLDYLRDDGRAEYLRTKVEDPTWEPPEPSAELLAEIFGTDDELYDDSIPF
jgi:hypothetical protein